MKILRVSIGVLICDKVYIYAYDFEKEIQARKLEIPFERNNVNGIKFMEIFRKDICSRETVESFIDDCMKTTEKIKEIESLLNEEYVLNLIKDNLKDRSFSDEEINSILKDRTISIKKKKDMCLNIDGLQKGSCYKRQSIKAPEPVLDMDIDQYRNMKVGKIVQTILRQILEENSVSKEELILMQTLEYSKKVFDLQYPVLVASDVEFDRVRYYKNPVYINEKFYYICSQWFEGKTNNDRPYLLKWIDGHK